MCGEPLCRIPNYLHMIMIDLRGLRSCQAAAARAREATEQRECNGRLRSAYLLDEHFRSRPLSPVRSARQKFGNSTAMLANTGTLPNPNLMHTCSNEPDQARNAAQQGVGGVQGR
jgi:hypothetical protein